MSFRSSKKGDLPLVTKVLALLVVAVIILMIVPDGIRKGFSATIDPLKDKLGLTDEEDKKEREREAEDELEEQATQFLNSLVDGYTSCVDNKGFASDSPDWKDPAGRRPDACNCKIEIDKQKLSNYHIDTKILNGKTTLELRSSSSSLVSKKEIEHNVVPCLDTVFQTFSAQTELCKPKTISIATFDDFSTTLVKGRHDGSIYLFFEQPEAYLIECPEK